MLEFNTLPKSIIRIENKKEVFIFNSNDDNIDQLTVDSFGEEWKKFNYFDENEIEDIGNEYFDIIDFSLFDKNSTVLDIGCGSGRWSVFLSSKISNVYAIDPSKAIYSAASLTKNIPNIKLLKASVENIPYNDNSFDLVVSLGVLHHIPDTQRALNSIVEKIKNGGQCLIYLYYSLDNKSSVYKIIFRISSLFRFIISKLPSFTKKIVCDIIAVIVYLPFIYFSNLIRFIFGEKAANKIPLSYYKNKSFNIVRNDSLDRFGTPLEQRFSKIEIEKMMVLAGLHDINFSKKQPFWHVTGKK